MVLLKHYHSILQLRKIILRVRLRTIYFILPFFAYFFSSFIGRMPTKKRLDSKRLAVNTHWIAGVVFAIKITNAQTKQKKNKNSHIKCYTFTSIHYCKRYFNNFNRCGSRILFIAQNDLQFKLSKWISRMHK